MASSVCGWCGRLVHFQAVSPLLIVPEGSAGVIQGAYSCPNCHHINLATEWINQVVSTPAVGQREEAQTRNWGPGVRWLPQRGERRDFPDVPGHIAEAASEATLCLSMGAYRAVGSLARAVIEATAKDKGASGPNLAARIDSLASGEHIRKHTKEQAHEIRYFGNDMAHGDFAAPVSEEEATEIIELMSEVLNEVYQSPARLARVKEARQSKESERSD